MTVLSVVEGTNAHLISEAAQLWIGPEDRVMDVTFGRGLWWKDVFTVERPCKSFVAHDKALDNVDFRQLPEPDESKDVIAFDPPYVSLGGRDTSGIPDFLDRYGLYAAPRRVDEMLEMNTTGLYECERVLAPGGRLLVKCSDYISGGKFVQGHDAMVNAAYAVDLEQVDEFIHFTGTGPQPKGRRQVHSRHAHSFLAVFRKRKRKRRTTSNTATTQLAA